MKYQPPYGISDPDAPYVNGDPSIARQGSILPAAAAEFPQREIVHVIEKSNIAPNDNDLYQLTRGVRSQWVNWVEDTGSANTLSVALDPPLTMYRQGLPLRVLAKQSNTGRTTINVNGLGNRLVVRADGSDLQAGDMVSGMIVLLVDDGTKFQMVNYMGAGGPGTITNYNIEIPYAVDTGTVNNVKGIYNPAITAPVDGDLVLIKIANKNTSAVMFQVNSLTPVPIVRNDGQALQSGDLELNEILLLVYNNARWQCLRLVYSQVMRKLSANLILYVRTDGNDTTGDGSVNDAAHAFKTIQRAVDYVAQSFAIAGRMVTIQLGVSGTYIGNVSVRSLPGRIVVRGDPNAMTSYVWQGPTNAACLDLVGAGTDVTVQGIFFSLQSPNNYYTTANYSAFLTIDNCAFTGVQTPWGCVGVTAAHAILLNNIHVYQHVGTICCATEGGTIICGAWYTHFITYSISFGSAFCWANGTAEISMYYGYVNWSGSAYGYRWIATGNSMVLTGGGTPDWLPGSVPGVADASSVGS